MLKLVHSGRTLREAKALMYAVSAGLHPEYTASGDLADLRKLEGGLNAISKFGERHTLSYRKIFKTRKDYISTPEETISKFLLSWKGGLPLSWARDGNLVRKGKPNKPRPGSSAGKVRQTKVSGVKGVLSDFKLLLNTLENLAKRHGTNNTKALKQAYKQVRANVTAGK
jgi:hypothetical protein